MNDKRLAYIRSTLGRDDLSDPAGYRPLLHEMVCEVEFQQQRIDQLRQALLAFAEAAEKPGRLSDCMTGAMLEDKAIVGLGVAVAAWKRASELTAGD